MKIKLIRLTVILLFSFSSSVFSGDINQQISSSDTVTISIKPVMRTYRSEIDDHLADHSNSSQNITFLITIKNNSAKPITIVHPYWSTVGNMVKGKPYTLENRREDSYGKSEIVLEITKPNGESIAIREFYLVNSFELNKYENGRYREEAVLQIGANEEVVFRKGWFFHSSMARWESEARAWEIFSKKGIYKVKIFFRNIYSTARINNYPSGTYEISNVWTGRVVSNEAVVDVW
jgi:hypothetical protein